MAMNLSHLTKRSQQLDIYSYGLRSSGSQPEFHWEICLLQFVTKRSFPNTTVLLIMRFCTKCYEGQREWGIQGELKHPDASFQSRCAQVRFLI